MGQAKRRGTFEQRQAAAIAKRSTQRAVNATAYVPTVLRYNTSVAPRHDRSWSVLAALAAMAIPNRSVFSFQKYPHD